MDKKNVMAKIKKAGEVPSRSIKVLISGADAI
jgi:hypothetical protein